MKDLVTKWQLRKYWTTCGKWMDEGAETFDGESEEMKDEVIDTPYNDNFEWDHWMWGYGEACAGLPIPASMELFAERRAIQRKKCFPYLLIFKEEESKEA